jgi:hypothetical protein
MKYENLLRLKGELISRNINRDQLIICKFSDRCHKFENEKP